MTSSNELKQQNGLACLRGLGMAPPHPIARIALVGALALTVPAGMHGDGRIGVGPFMMKKQVCDDTLLC